MARLRFWFTNVIAPVAKLSSPLFSFHFANQYRIARVASASDRKLISIARVGKVVDQIGFEVGELFYFAASSKDNSKWKYGIRISRPLRLPAFSDGFLEGLNNSKCSIQVVG